MIPEHRPTRLPVFIASALSKLYALGISHQNIKYDQGKGVCTLDRKVISVGNLSAGGTGKTPLVQHIARTLINAGHNPVIAMRGYKSKPDQISDEQQEHIDALPGIPIVAQPDRNSGLEALFATSTGAAIDSVILDDGFQHRKIARDLDIVVIDASRPPYQDALLPLGFLRETSDALARADMVVITHAEMVEQHQLGELRRWLGKHLPPDTHVAVTEHTWDLLSEYTTDPDAPVAHDVGILKDKPVAVLTGIGHPDAFVAMAQEVGARVMYRCDRPDHDAFPDTMIAEFVERARASGAQAVLTSNKDWARLKSRFDGLFPAADLPLLVTSLGLAFRSGESEFDSRCHALFEDSGNPQG